MDFLRREAATTAKEQNVKIIQDFRSETGLYNLIQSQQDQADSRVSPKPPSLESSLSPVATPRIHHPPNAAKLKGKDLFSSDVWKDPESTSIFHSFIASLRGKIRDEVKPSATHRFIRTLRDRRRLVRCYTQNIDGLEAQEGLCTALDRGKGSRSRFTTKAMELRRTAASVLPGGKLDGGCEVVQLHGNLEVLRCNLCRATFAWEGEGREALLLDGKAPECQSCRRQDEERRDRGKRGTKVGSLRPNIILYGEDHPLADAVGAISMHDLRFGPDILLILGTSLHVHGLKALVKEFAKAVHAKAKGTGKVIFINLSKPSESVWNGVIDYWVSMDCDEWVYSLRHHRPDLWHIQEPLNLQVRKQDTGAPKQFLEEQQKKKAEEDKENKSTSPPRPKPERSPSKIKLRGPLEDIMKKPFNTASNAQAVASCTDKLSSSIKVHQPPMQTPPPTRHGDGFQKSPRKRSLPVEEEILKTTPKRRKKEALEIWQEDV